MRPAHAICLILCLIAASKPPGTQPGGPTTRRDAAETAVYRDELLQRLQDKHIANRTSAAIALGVLGDASVVPALLESLRFHNNQRLYNGGTEQWLPVRIMRAELTNTIEALTGLESGISDAPDPKMPGQDLPSQEYDDERRIDAFLRQVEDFLKQSVKPP